MRLPIAKVTSGLQTGVDQVGLEVAWLEGYPTGGVAPKGYRTDAGPAVELGQFYGLTESWTAQYRPRTITNAQAADLTLWFGNLGSPGGRLTLRYAAFQSLNEEAADIRAFILERAEELGRAVVVNVAGNRLRTNRAASEQARAVLTEALRCA